MHVKKESVRAMFLIALGTKYNNYYEWNNEVMDIRDGVNTCLSEIRLSSTTKVDRWKWDGHWKKVTRLPEHLVLTLPKPTCVLKHLFI